MKTDLKQRDIEEIARQALIAEIKELKAIMSPTDYFMNTKSLSRYSGISVRKLKDLIRHPEYPLPAYKVEGRIKIKKSELGESLG